MRQNPTVRLAAVLALPPDPDYPFAATSLQADVARQITELLNADDPVNIFPGNDVEETGLSFEVHQPPGRVGILEVDAHGLITTAALLNGVHGDVHLPDAQAAVAWLRGEL